MFGPTVAAGTPIQNRSYKQALEFLEEQGVIEYVDNYIVRREVFT